MSSVLVASVVALFRERRAERESKMASYYKNEIVAKKDATNGSGQGDTGIARGVTWLPNRYIQGFDNIEVLQGDQTAIHYQNLPPSKTTPKNVASS